MAAPKKEEKIKARKMRRNGMSVKKIAKNLEVSVSSISIWVRDIPQPEKYTKKYKEKEKEKRLLRIKKERDLRRKKKFPSDEKIKAHIHSVEKTGKGLLSRRLISGDGRWMIPALSYYKGKKYIGNRYVYEHRIIIEESLGRLLEANEIVHHINGDKFDNRAENLSVMYRGDHTSKHSKKKTYIDLKCAFCGKEIKRELRHYKRNKNAFCCLSHSAKFQHRNKYSGT